MLGLNEKLLRREEEGNRIQVGIAGAGQMGRGMVSQIMLMKGMRPAVIADIRLENARQALRGSAVSDDDIVVADSVAEAEAALSNGYFVITDEPDIVTEVGQIDCVVDATGVPEAGARIAMETILNGKHIVMLNVETDVVVGPWLKKLADSAGVVYTGSAGDEPGSVKELYDFADALGFEISAIGKGKNNTIDLAATPDSVAEEAAERGMSPKMLTAFKDGTKTMVELTAMSNATGFVPGVRGAYGIKATVEDLYEVLPKQYSLKANGGILDQLGVVDYVEGIAPGVFVVVTSNLPYVLEVMSYLKMGPGPNYALYRPYHLTSLETPLSIAKAVIEHEPTIVPRERLISETVAVAKRDLKPGDFLDGIGGSTVYGTIERADLVRVEQLLPLGLVNKKSRVTAPVTKGAVVPRAAVEHDRDSLIYQLRVLQDTLVDCRIPEKV